ncbi:MAG: D-alanyl-D-alanine carboxypeptidase DacC [Halieaceae bacterium]|nr:MAG: D-alanyl-D-alanine carboxypeptidase DacC [Halieaceae bacterium]
MLPRVGTLSGQSLLTKVYVIMQLMCFRQVLIFGWALAASAAMAAVPPAPKLPADAYFLMDATTGQVLVDHNGDLALPPASLTKIMTSYVLAEEVDAGRASLDDMITVSRKAWSQNPTFNGSSLMWIEPGKQVSLADLERGIVISSGNDASVAVAEHLAGTEASFVDVMNQLALELGLTNTIFRNPHGLPHPEHRSTARDLAKLSVALINSYPEHYKIYKERSFTYNGIKQFNRNSLLRSDSTVDGLKTGYTSEAGYGLVASAQRDDMRLVSVVLGSASTRSRTSESSSLLNYGFRFFQNLRPLSAEVTLVEPKVWKGAADSVYAGVLKSIVLTVPRERSAADIEIITDEQLEAPLLRGDEIGMVRVVRGGELIYETPLVVLEDVPSGGFLKRLIDALILWFQNLAG